MHNQITKFSADDLKQKEQKNVMYENLKKYWIDILAHMNICYKIL